MPKDTPEKLYRVMDKAEILRRWFDDTARVREVINHYAKTASNLRAEHIEMMCAAYLMATDIDPARVILVEDWQGGRVEWYFTEGAESK